jgi:hypothetical protein
LPEQLVPQVVQINRESGWQLEEVFILTSPNKSGYASRYFPFGVVATELLDKIDGVTACEINTDLPLDSISISSADIEAVFHFFFGPDMNGELGFVHIVSPSESDAQTDEVFRDLGD